MGFLRVVSITVLFGALFSCGQSPEQTTVSNGASAPASTGATAPASTGATAPASTGATAPMPTPAPTTSSALLSVTWTDWNTDEEFLLSGKKVTAGEAVAYCTGLRMSNAGTGLVTAAIDAGLINAYENIELNNSVSGPRLVWVVNFANELRTEAFDVSRRAIVAPPSQALVVCVK